ncbi:uncharacterized protein LOC126829589 [Patella vulgata]|uniref:uncharacterized protein LOC126829589 n=1 Tax=Patella vulgata TaxID=6465 RepID=UPI00217F6F25|nr:uncharacterized protein LOC126829589 [Patella vulgata]
MKVFNMFKKNCWYLLYVFVISTLTEELISDANSAWLKFNLINADKFVSLSTQLFYTDMQGVCGKNCKDRTWCVSFTFNKNRRECHLYNTNLNETANWINDTGTKVFSVKTEGINVAHQKPTFSSSLVNGRSSDQAVDGDITPQNYDLTTFCYQTASTDFNPWFMVDLGYVYMIKIVVVYNADDYPERLHDVNYELFSTDPSNDPSAVPNCCASVPNFNTGKNIIRCNKGVSGRFLKISIQNSRFLTLCEVEVLGKMLNDTSYCGGQQLYSCKLFPGGPNIALGKPTSESSLREAAHRSSRANDGLKPLTYKTCTHSAAGDFNPWWQIDLQDLYNITSVTIANRVDDKQVIGNRLSDVSIRVYETTPSMDSPNNLCKFIPGEFGCIIRTIECDKSTIGRWIRISKPTEYLTLCEVEVTGHLI